MGDIRHPRTSFGLPGNKGPQKSNKGNNNTNDHALYQTKGSYYLDGISIDILRHLVVNDTVHEQARERERETERERDELKVKVAITEEMTSVRQNLD